jgi:acyl carrier protein
MQQGNKEIIRDYLMKHAKISKLGDNEKIIETNYLDSMGIIDFAAWLETRFGIQVTDEDFSEENFSDLLNITDFVEKKQKTLK